MKKVLLMMMMGLVSMTGFAQTNEVAVDSVAQDSIAQDSVDVMKFAYLSYDSVMVIMPEYAEMQKNMAQMEKDYGAELQRVVSNFNKQYEVFLDGMSSYPPTILQKRQSELQSMLDKNIEFKKETQKLLKQAKDEMLGAIKRTIDDAVSVVALEKGYAFVLNKDESSVTFINPINGVDITEDVKVLIQK